jgi:hypothetical protein
MCGVCMFRYLKFANKSKTGRTAVAEPCRNRYTK